MGATPRLILGAKWNYKQIILGQAGVTKNHFGCNLRLPRIICGATRNCQKVFVGQPGITKDHFGVNPMNHCVGNQGLPKILLGTAWDPERSPRIILGETSTIICAATWDYQRSFSGNMGSTRNICGATRNWVNLGSPMIILGSTSRINVLATGD